MVFSLAKCRLDADILRLRYRDMQLAMAAVADKSQGGISSSRGGRLTHSLTPRAALQGYYHEHLYCLAGLDGSRT